MKYPKFRDKEDCAFPERNDCNYGEEIISREFNEKTGITTIKQKNYNRCQYMKFISLGNWTCCYEKSNKQYGKTVEGDKMKYPKFRDKEDCAYARIIARQRARSPHHRNRTTAGR